MSKQIQVTEAFRQHVETLTEKKVYNFGKFQDASVTTYYGTPIVCVELRDPVGTYETAVEFYETYSDGSGRAKLHALTCNAKYN